MKDKKIKDFLKFEDFIQCRQSGRWLVNPYWLEYLLNLFYQGYLGEVWEEVMDTKINMDDTIERVAYGIIGREFNSESARFINESPL